MDTILTGARLRTAAAAVTGARHARAGRNGQEVKGGEKLAVIEAMKMENVLRAEHDAVVKSVLAKTGDSLAVDQPIIEFQ